MQFATCNLMKALFHYFIYQVIMPESQCRMISTHQCRMIFFHQFHLGIIYPQYCRFSIVIFIIDVNTCFGLNMEFASLKSVIMWQVKFLGSSNSYAAEVLTLMETWVYLLRFQNFRGIFCGIQYTINRDIHSFFSMG